MVTARRSKETHDEVGGYVASGWSRRAQNGLHNLGIKLSTTILDKLALCKLGDLEGRGEDDDTSSSDRHGVAV